MEFDTSHSHNHLFHTIDRGRLEDLQRGNYPLKIEQKHQESEK